MKLVHNSPQEANSKTRAGSAFVYPQMYAYIDVTTVPLTPPCCNYLLGCDKTLGCGHGQECLGAFVSLVSGTGSLFGVQMGPILCCVAASGSVFFY